MKQATDWEFTGWERLDRAAFGIIYGAIMVLGILMATGDHHQPPLKMAGLLFGSVLAVTLAKAFAELLSHALDTGERMTRDAVRNAWRHSRPTLAVANLPTCLFLGAAFDLVSSDMAVFMSQGLCLTLLATLGARVGWVIDGRVGSALLGGLFAAVVGLGLALMKFIVH